MVIALLLEKSETDTYNAHATCGALRLWQSGARAHILFENIEAGTWAWVEAYYVADCETGADVGAVPKAEAEAKTKTPNLLLAQT